MNKIIVYCGSSTGHNPAYTEAAIALAQYMAKNNYSLVYGAGSVGLMGVLANEMLANNAEVLGVIPDFLKCWEVDHKGISQTFVTDTMHQRKQKLAELGHAVIALPGGFGTLDELFEILTWAQLGLHSMPIGLLNVAGFYDPLIAMLERMVTEGFLKPENLQLLLIDHDIERLFQKLEAHKPAFAAKWIHKA
jgi:uncharacterized protein (TIGR00730 family)